MKKTKQPDTSTAAYKSITPDMLRDHYKRIVSALEKLKTANYEKIAQVAGFSDRNMASRRLKEMILLGLVVRTDLKSATSSGRSAYNYSLPGEKRTTVQVVDDIVNNAGKGFKQTELFV